MTDTPTFRSPLAALEAAQRAGFSLSVSDGHFWAFRKDVRNSRPFSLVNRRGDFLWERQRPTVYVVKEAS